MTFDLLDLQPRPRPLLGWLWQVSLAGLVNFGLAFGNYRNGQVPVFSCEKALNIKKNNKNRRPRSRLLDLIVVLSVLFKIVAYLVFHSKLTLFDQWQLEGARRLSCINYAKWADYAFFKAKQDKRLRFANFSSNFHPSWTTIFNPIRPSVMSISPTNSHINTFDIC